MQLNGRHYRVRITAADPESVLTKLSSGNITLTDVEWIDFLTIDLTLQKSAFAAMKSILDKGDITCQVLKKDGCFWRISQIWKRPVLTFGGILFLLLACLLPRYIFFVKVSGNEKVASGVILQEAENCGIRFGTKASKVRSEEVKNQLLGSLPQLQWVGINTTGNLAVIQVKERNDVQQAQDDQGSVSGIVAAQDGVITQMEVHRGTPLITVGQTVRSGQVLISGYTDCGLKIIAQQAAGEVFAHTTRRLFVISPLPSARRGECVGKQTTYRLRIGKKVINLWNHSGNQDSTCVKMYSEDYWTLPGGFRLPVSVIKETSLLYESSADVCMEERTWLMQYANEYLLSQMVAGEVLNESLIWNMSDDYWVLFGEYACHEMIGQVKREETIE